MNLVVENIQVADSFKNSRIFVDYDNVRIVNHNRSNISESLKNRFLQNVDKFIAANNYFQTELFGIESEDDLSLNSRTEAYFYIVEHFNDNWTKSPYSNSYYNSKDIDWNYKPEGSLRVSDHWNFESADQLHCQTNNSEFKKGWALGQYKNGQYKIIKYF